MVIGVELDRMRFVQAKASHNLWAALITNWVRWVKATGQPRNPSLTLSAIPATIWPGLAPRSVSAPQWPTVNRQLTRKQAI